MVETDSLTEVMFSDTDYIADMKLNYLAITQSVGNLGTVGVSAKVFSVGDIERTTETAPDGTGASFSPTFSTLGLSFARKRTDRADSGATVACDDGTIME